MEKCAGNESNSYIGGRLINITAMSLKKSLSQTHLKLQTKEGRKEMLFQEVVSSSKMEGIKNAEAILKKW
jgi:hypothetical protein